MTAKRPSFAVPWHPSDQPEVIADRDLRRRVRRHALPEYLLTGLTALAGLPLAAVRWASRDRLRSTRPPPPRALAGVGVAPRPDLGAAVPELLDELGVRRVLLRLPLRDPATCAGRLAFAGGLSADVDVLPVAMQERDHVCHHDLWRADLRRLLTGLPPRIGALQVGIAPNRLKWGCATVGEYLDLLEIAAEEAAQLRPGLRLVGPGVIDFEPLALVRALWNRRRFRLHACACLLYVDRRGGPEGRQWGLDLAGKLELMAVIAACSPRKA